MSCFALLDDLLAPPDRAASRLYTGFAREVRCDEPTQLEAAWGKVEAAQAAGLHAVVLADYEWGARLAGINSAPRAPGPEGVKPGSPDANVNRRGALRVLLFERLARLRRDEVDAWLAALEGESAPAPAGIMNLCASVGRDDFCAAIERVHAAIREGETYQVNYTLRLDFDAYGPPVALYRRLRTAQPVAYGALVALPIGPTGHGEPEYVLSCSPELFLRHEAGRLIARPMKGTAARAVDAGEDARAARALANDPKNRAENLMIVDLLRNDLGRVAETGSVRVPALFTVEPYPTVFQMTSTVQATLPPETGFPAVLRALFPCGSITGAPKHRTMQLIAELETEPRGLYTGGIGWIDAPPADRRCGDFCLSVAIRTLALGAARGGLRPGRLGVGAGIVIDSRADAEYAETLLKARFVTTLDPGFALFETLHATRDGVRHLERHLARLAASAAMLGFTCEVGALRASIAARLAALPGDEPCRMRLQLERDGTHRVEVHALKPLPAVDDAPVETRFALGAAAAPTAPVATVRLLLADEPIDADDPLLRHKTTRRARYDDAIRAAEAHGAFDILYFNRSGELAEGARSNVFVRLDGRWLTPPLKAGVLPGVMRAVLLDDPAWDAREARITRADLARAERIVVCNALRGVLDARLVEPCTSAV